MCNNGVGCCLTIFQAVLAKQAQPCVVSGMHPQGAFVTSMLYKDYSTNSNSNIVRLSKSANLKEVAKAAASLQRIVEDLSPDAKPGEIAPILATIGFSEGNILVLYYANPTQRNMEASKPKQLTPKGFNTFPNQEGC